VKSLIASLKGCGIPAIPTLLGPFRNCLYLRIFRSRRVIKATFTRTGIIIKKKDKILISQKYLIYFAKCLI